MVQLPRYRQMADQIKQAVREGVLPPDSRLPSVRVLAAQYNVSLTTALKVLRTLEDEHVAVAPRFSLPLRKAAVQRHTPPILPRWMNRRNCICRWSAKSAVSGSIWLTGGGNSIRSEN